MESRFHYAWVLKEQGVLSDAERMMQATMLQYNHMLPNELFLGCMAMGAELLSINGSLSKAEMLCYKSLGAQEKAYGKHHRTYIGGLIQLAQMGVTHKLNRQAEEMATQDSTGNMVPSKNTLLALLILGQLQDASAFVDDAADMGHRIYHPNHPFMIRCKMINIGMNLVQLARSIDKMRSLSVISSYLSNREHLLTKASVLTAKVFVIYRAKLGPEHRLTKVTRGLLTGIIDRVRSCFRQAFTVGKLVNPDDDHTRFGQGLADALFGQNKAHEAQQALRAAGLMKGGAVPTSYLRFMNTRAMQHIQKAAADKAEADKDDHEEEEEDGEGEEMGTA
eukprot:gene4017-14096_t